MKEGVMANLFKYQKALRNIKFREIQQLAMSKGFKWIHSGRLLHPAYRENQDLMFTLRFHTKIMLYDNKAREISFRQMVKLVKELPDEL